MRFTEFPISGNYNVVYADPPWQYRDKSLHRGGAAKHYDTLSTFDIESLPVSAIAGKNSALFLWTTLPNIPEALKVINSWGFTYKTAAFVWVKTNKHAGTLYMGMGHYTRANGELCLLATRGRLSVVDRSIKNIVISPREKHSKKPDIVRENIVKLLGDIPRIELFARECAEGWDCWGNEVPKAGGLE